MQFKKELWADILLHPAALWTISLIIIHQSIIAASSYFLTQLIEAFQMEKNYDRHFVFYLLAMSIPYLPGCLSFITLQDWINKAHYHFIQRISDSAYGLIEKYRCTELREIIESIVGRNAFIVIKAYLDFLHGLFGFLLNSMLSMIVLGILLPGNLLFGYICSVLLCIVIIFLLRNKITDQSTNIEKRFITYSENLSRIWDNTILGNAYHFSRWKKKNNRLAHHYYTQSNQLQLLKQISNVLLACASLGPTIYLVAYAIYHHSTEPTLIAAIIVNLTRIFHILNSLSTLVYQFLEWTSMHTRLAVLYSAQNSLDEETTSLPPSPISEIRLNTQPVHSFEQIILLLREKTQGRFTLRGDNGSGKSTCLMALKKAFSEQALLIPTDSSKLCWEKNTSNLSTGQCALSHLHEIAQCDEVKYLLLDEWDANLDAINTQKMDMLLDTLSKKKVVVEIRH